MILSKIYLNFFTLATIVGVKTKKTEPICFIKLSLYKNIFKNWSTEATLIK